MKIFKFYTQYRQFRQLFRQKIEHAYPNKIDKILNNFSIIWIAFITFSTHQCLIQSHTTGNGNFAVNLVMDATVRGSVSTSLMTKNQVFKIIIRLTK